jgi:hypothetical protein
MECAVRVCGGNNSYERKFERKLRKEKNFSVSETKGKRKLLAFGFAGKCLVRM